MTAYQFYRERLGLKREDLLKELAEKSKRETGRKKEILIRQGEVCNNLYLLESGMARGVLIDEGGHEFTDCLIRAEWEIAVFGLSKLEMDVPAHKSMELTEDSTFFIIPLNEVLRLGAKYKEIVQTNLWMLERSWKNQADVKRARYVLEATDRYLWFRKAYPGVENRMLQRDIASFLNMKAQTLSKISGKYKSI